MAAGIAGSAVGKDALNAVAAAQVGKNAVENNLLSSKNVMDLRTELVEANKKGESTEAIWEKYKNLSAEQRAEMLAGCAGTGGFCTLSYQSEAEGGIQIADGVSSLRWLFGLSKEDAARLNQFVTAENQNDMGLLYNSLPAWEKAALIGKELLSASGTSIGRDKISIASIVGKTKGTGASGTQAAGTQATGAKGIIKASETIGQPVEAVIGGRKRLLRVDIEPNGKLQIQSGGGKESIVDFRPDLSKPLAPQINTAFKRLPQSARDQLIRNAEKGLKRLQETGNM